MKRPSALSAPFLKRISLLTERADPGAFPFDRLAFLNDPDFALDFPQRVTFFVGENGTGKSTLLEASAALCGFPAEGGAQDHLQPEEADGAPSRLAEALRPSWLPRVRSGSSCARRASTTSPAISTTLATSPTSTAAASCMPGATVNPFWRSCVSGCTTGPGPGRGSTVTP